MATLMGAELGKIERLRAFLPLSEGERRLAPLGHAPADAVLAGGVRCGALHEVFAGEPGHEATASGFAFMLAFRASTRKALLWIRQDFGSLETGEIFASGLLELGADPARILLFRAAHIEDALRAAGEGLACTGLGALVLETWGESKLLDLSLSRRLTLAAARHNVTVIHLCTHATPSNSAAETRWLVRAHPSPPHEENGGMPVFDASLARNRHGTTGQWVMEWNADDGAFRETAHLKPVAAPAFDRPAATAMGAKRRYG
jgi:protein ImuA